MSDRDLHTQLLLRAGRILLEYNESSGAIVRTLKATAGALTADACHVAVSYLGVAVSLAGDSLKMETAQELRFNSAVQTRAHEILDQVRGGQLTPAAALEALGQVEANTSRYSRWLVALLIGAAAASFARLLGADWTATGVAGVASALGVLARQELGKRHFCLLTLPLTASLIGSILGGLTIRLGGTETPGLILVVPALMVVPGPHLLNGLFDLIDNHLPMSLSRLGLAGGILLASALGIVVGIVLTVPDPTFVDRPAVGGRLTVVGDMILAGIATCGFAAFYNTPWRHLGIVAAGGMLGHGVRFLGLQAGLQLEVATFLGGLVVGLVAAWGARTSRAPVAVIAFAGAVTMIPGSTLYRALGGALQLARVPETDTVLAARTLSHALEGGLVVAALGLGLVLGIRLVQWLFEVFDKG